MRSHQTRKSQHFTSEFNAFLQMAAKACLGQKSYCWTKYKTWCTVTAKVVFKFWPVAVNIKQTYRKGLLCTGSTISWQISWQSYSPEMVSLSFDVSWEHGTKWGRQQSKLVLSRLELVLNPCGHVKTVKRATSNGTFSKLSTLQEYQYCHFCFSCAIRN